MSLTAIAGIASAVLTGISAVKKSDASVEAAGISLDVAKEQTNQLEKKLEFDRETRDLNLLTADKAIRIQEDAAKAEIELEKEKLNLARSSTLPTVITQESNYTKYLIPVLIAGVIIYFKKRK